MTETRPYHTSQHGLARKLKTISRMSISTGMPRNRSYDYFGIRSWMITVDRGPRQG